MSVQCTLYTICELENQLKKFWYVVVAAVSYHIECENLNGYIKLSTLNMAHNLIARILHWYKCLNYDASNRAWNTKLKIEMLNINYTFKQLVYKKYLMCIITIALFTYKWELRKQFNLISMILHCLFVCSIFFYFYLSFPILLLLFVCTIVYCFQFNPFTRKLFMFFPFHSTCNNELMSWVMPEFLWTDLN